MSVALAGLRNVLSGTPPVNVQGIVTPQRDVNAALGQLERAVLVRPRFGLSMASHVVDLFRSEILGRDTPGACELAMSHGLYKWDAVLGALVSERNDMSHDEWLESLQEL